MRPLYLYLKFWELSESYFIFLNKLIYFNVQLEFKDYDFDVLIFQFPFITFLTYFINILAEYYPYYNL